MNLKNAIKALTPPILWNLARNFLKPPAPAPSIAPSIAPEPPAEKQYGHVGDFPSFDDAFKACGPGYHNAAILEKTQSGTADIRHAPAIMQLNIRLLAGMQYAIMRTQGPINVLDFGGALGGHYFHLRGFLPGISSWTVVEIEQTVRLGSARFADNVLRFAENFDGTASIVLSSGALQYTPDPYAHLDRLCAMESRFLILDKVPLLDRDRWTAQNVHPSLFGDDVSFPAFFFSDRRFRNRLAPRRIVMEWELPGYSALLDGAATEIYRGFVLERA